MIACPACKRRSFTYREMLAVRLDGLAKCPACGELARMDQMSRSLLAIVLALLLWMLLLSAGIFYSGYLFIFSTVVIVIGWRLLSAAVLPVLALEQAPGHTRFDRGQNMVMLATLIVTAIFLDGLMSYRSDADNRHAAATSSSKSAPSQ